MRKKLKDLFKFKKDVTKREGTNREGTNHGEEESSDEIGKLLNDVNEMCREIDKEIMMENCSHDWVDYDDIYLNEIAKDMQDKTERQLERILIKKLNGPLDDLDSKMLQLFMVWSLTSRVPGKCMMCSKNVVIHINNNMMY